MKTKEIWLFNSASFAGNPKWLFLYINNYKKDIVPYWITNNKKDQKLIKSFGYKTCRYDTSSGKKLMSMASVYVVDQFKEVIPVELNNAKILNLWHGVGCKYIEKNVDKRSSPLIKRKIVKKYIRNNNVYKNNTMFLVTSKFMENHFIEDCNLKRENIIRGGYPCNMYQVYLDKVKTYNHDKIFRGKINDKTKIVVYAPTYNDKNNESFFSAAIPNLDKLVKKLEENNILFIFKMHPLAINDKAYLNAMKNYKDHKNLLFWDNKYDIYEVFYKIDMAVVDYSSIFYDMLSSGVKKFVRYIFNYDTEDFSELKYDYLENTCGNICRDFDGLLKELDNFEVSKDELNDLNLIYDKFWAYQNEDSFEEIYNRIKNFKISDKVLPDLYSFDVFDTLIQRKTLVPVGIFYCVKDKIRKSNIQFPLYFVEKYPTIRNECEKNVREFYNKSLLIRKDDKVEITFEEIFVRMKNVYNLSDEQVEFLKNAEIEAEVANCEARPEGLEMVKELLNDNQKVIMISDMYLSKEIIRKMLVKASPIYKNIPLYLSSEYGYQKVNGKLYYNVFFDLDYNYNNWYHFGDNKISDFKTPKLLGIKAKLHSISKFNKYETAIVSHLNCYDAYLVSTLFARFRKTMESDLDYFSFSYISLYMVPYVSWLLKDALKKNIKTLYFVSRDGYLLKIVADAIIKKKKYKIKTRYFYGSRKAWRVASYIDVVDEEFFSLFGDLVGVKNYSQLLQALHLDDDKFKELFPDLIEYVNLKRYDKKDLAVIIEVIKKRQEYHNYLLSVSKKLRETVNAYLKQEINNSENYAFVEYWARGYTQDCLTRLLKDTFGEEIKSRFYYVRSIYPSLGDSIRENFSSTTAPLTYVESIFANNKYNSVPCYVRKGNRIVPALSENPTCDFELLESCEKNLVLFAELYCSLNFIDENSINVGLLEAAMKFARQANKNKLVVKYMAPLKYSGASYTTVYEYAPALTLKDCIVMFLGIRFEDKTQDLKMSLYRSNKFYVYLYNIKCKYARKKLVKKMVTKLREKRILK